MPLFHASTPPLWVTNPDLLYTLHLIPFAPTTLKLYADIRMEWEALLVLCKSPDPKLNCHLAGIIANCAQAGTPKKSECRACG